MPPSRRHRGRSLPPPAARKALFERELLEDLRFWVETDRRVALRALQIVDAVLKDPFQGIGKPEPLKHLLAGAWSRRLAQEHRLVYLVDQDHVAFLQARPDEHPPRSGGGTS